MFDFNLHDGNEYAILGLLQTCYQGDERSQELLQEPQDSEGYLISYGRALLTPSGSAALSVTINMKKYIFRAELKLNNRGYTFVWNY